MLILVIKSSFLISYFCRFIKRFRLSKEAFQYVLTKININSHDTKAVPAVLQLAASLSLLASGSYQHEIGSDYLIGMCQSTISKLTSNFYKEMENKLCPEFIRFDLNESHKCKEWFVEQYKIPGGKYTYLHRFLSKVLCLTNFYFSVIGCVDGTHIGLQKPTKDEHMYFNRKGFHSLNAMIVSNYILHNVSRLSTFYCLRLLDLRSYLQDPCNQLSVWGCST